MRAVGFATFGGPEVLQAIEVLKFYAEYVVVSADQIVLKPRNMPWEVAGGFSGNGQGAHMALKAFPLHQAADAHREVESGHGRGKVVLTVDEIE
jgi:NADPH:quinone reductase-like Zn-dependent oxidoreductase